MNMWRMAFRYAPLALKWYSKHKGDFKLPTAGLGALLGQVQSDEAANWESLAKHLQTQTKQHVAAARGLRTKASFVLVAATFVLAPFISTRFESSVLEYIAAIALAGSVALALWIMCGKTPSALDAPGLVDYLTSHPDASKLQFQKWLAKGYAASYAELDETYAKTETMLRYSTGLLLLSFVLIIASKLAA